MNLPFEKVHRILPQLGWTRVANTPRGSSYAPPPQAGVSSDFQLYVPTPGHYSDAAATLAKLRSTIATVHGVSELRVLTVLTEFSPGTWNADQLALRMYSSEPDRIRFYRHMGSYPGELYILLALGEEPPPDVSHYTLEFFFSAETSGEPRNPLVGGMSMDYDEKIFSILGKEPVDFCFQDGFTQARNHLRARLLKKHDYNDPTLHEIDYDDSNWKLQSFTEMELTLLRYRDLANFISSKTANSQLKQVVDSIIRTPLIQSREFSVP